MSHPARPYMVNIADLVGVGDIAKLYYVAPPTVCTWRLRYPDFPKPVTQLSSGPVFLLPEVIAWYRARDERPRRRP